MLTEQFINSCLSLIMNNKFSEKNNKSVYRDIKTILDFYKKKEKQDIPIPIKNKVECLDTIINLKIDGRTSDNILDSISLSEKYKGIIDYLILKMNEDVDESVNADNVEQIRIRKKLMGLFNNYDKISEFLDTFKNGSFKSLDDMVGNYEIFVKQMYTNLMECNRAMTVEESTSLDLLIDDYTPVVDLIKDKMKEENLIKSGFPVLDNKILGGGFQKGRLYIFAGASGSGKSTFLTNIIENGLNEKSNNDKKGVYIYITMENLIDETLSRVYQSMFSITNENFQEHIRELSGNDIKDSLVNKISQSNSSVIFKYFPKFSISPTDISMVIDDTISIYGQDGIKAVFVDYLDLLKSDYSNKNYEYRLELSHITSNLKDIAVGYKIPVITVTQLNREVYSKNPDAKGMNLGMVGEAIKKVEHADFVALMSKEQNSDNVVYMNVGKNRCGAANRCLEFNVDFTMFKFLECYESGQNDSPNAMTDNVKSYGGVPSFESF